MRVGVEGGVRRDEEVTVAAEDERAVVMGRVRRDGLVGVEGTGWLDTVAEEMVGLLDTGL